MPDPETPTPAAALPTTVSVPAIADKYLLWQAAHFLVERASALGLVLTIEQRSLQPLAQGHYETIVSVREARK